MERKEPTLSPSAGVSESVDPVTRRAQAYSSAQEEDDTPRARTPRQQPAPAPVAYVAQAPSSSLPVVALVFALIAVAGAGFLGWQLFQAQALLKQAEDRILGLEQQLNLTSEESSASVVTLQANLKKTDADLRKLIAATEDNRKAAAANAEKITAVGRDAAAAKKEATDAKAGLSSIKQEVAANKAVADAAAAKIDSAATSISQQSKNVDDLREELSKLQLELADLDSLAARTNKNEEAISAIDDFRRSTNRELLQIKQQLGTAPK